MFVQIYSSYIICSYHAFDLLAADRASSDGLVSRFIENSPRCTRLAHDSMTAVEKDSVDLSTEANIAVIKRLLFLLQQVRQFIHLLLQHDYFFAQEGIIFPLHFRLTPTVDREVGGDCAHHATCRWGGGSESLYRLLDLLDVHRARKCNMVQIIETCSIEASHHVHYIIEYHWLVEGSLLWNHSSSVFRWPFSTFYFITK